MHISYCNFMPFFCYVFMQVVQNMNVAVWYQFLGLVVIIHKYLVFVMIDQSDSSIPCVWIIIVADIIHVYNFSVVFASADTKGVLCIFLHDDGEVILFYFCNSDIKNNVIWIEYERLFLHKSVLFLKGAVKSNTYVP